MVVTIQTLRSAKSRIGELIEELDMRSRTVSLDVAEQVLPSLREVRTDLEKPMNDLKRIAVNIRELDFAEKHEVEEIERPETSIRGTVSEGTMLADDLIPKFIAALAEVKPEEAEGRELEFVEIVESGGNEESKRWVLRGLFDALDAIAPEGYYFGASPGDGADYGFWKCDDSESDE